MHEMQPSCVIIHLRQVVLLIFRGISQDCIRYWTINILLFSTSPSFPSLLFSSSFFDAFLKETSLVLFSKITNKIYWNIDMIYHDEIWLTTVKWSRPQWIQYHGIHMVSIYLSYGFIRKYSCQKYITGTINWLI